MRVELTPADNTAFRSGSFVVHYPGKVLFQVLKLLFQFVELMFFFRAVHFQFIAFDLTVVYLFILMAQIFL